jgi:hypothetical protein
MGQKSQHDTVVTCLMDGSWFAGLIEALAMPQAVYICSHWHQHCCYWSCSLLHAFLSTKIPKPVLPCSVHANVVTPTATARSLLSSCRIKLKAATACSYAPQYVPIAQHAGGLTGIGSAFCLGTAAGLAAAAASAAPPPAASWPGWLFSTSSYCCPATSIARWCCRPMYTCSQTQHVAVYNDEPMHSSSPWQTEQANVR